MNNSTIYKRLYKDYSKKYLNKIILSAFFSILVAGSTSSIAWLLDPAIKKIFIEKDQSLIILIPLLIILSFTIKGLSLYFAKTTMIGVGESFSLGQNLGLDPEKLFEILSTSTGSCWAINSYCPIKGVGPTSPADDDFRPGFSADLMLKDLTIALKAIESTNTSAPFGKNSKENFERMVNGNQGSLDFSAITKFNK